MADVFRDLAAESVIEHLGENGNRGKIPVTFRHHGESELKAIAHNELEQAVSVIWADFSRLAAAVGCRQSELFSSHWTL
jgi:hypothetical protein